MPTVTPIESLELMAHFSFEQKLYFDKLKAELLDLFSGQTYEEIKATEDAPRLKKIADKLEQMIRFVETKQLPGMFFGKKKWGEEELRLWIASQLSVEGLIERWFQKYINIDGAGNIELGTKVSSSKGFKFSTWPELPPNLVLVIGTLDLSNFQGDRLPPELTVRGSLILNSSQIKTIPDGLRVEGNVFCRNTSRALSDKLETLRVRGQITGNIYP